jgi:hypothetical protein
MHCVRKISRSPLRKLCNAVLLLCSAALPGCKHVENINGDLKRDFNFKVGSYWIMKDSATGRTDSFYVASQSNTHGMMNSMLLDWYETEIVDIFIAQHSLDAAYAADSFRYEWWMKGGFIDFNLFHPWAKTVSGRELGMYMHLSYPFAEHTQRADSSATDLIGFYYGGHYPAYTFNGQSYSNVFELAHDKEYGKTSSTPYFFYNQLLLSSEAGYIKFRQRHPQDSFSYVWELQRSHIVK